MKIKEVSVLNLAASHIYVSDKIVGWQPVLKNSLGEFSLSGWTTYCKEEIGKQCVSNGYSRFVVMPPKRLSDEEVTELTSWLHEHEKEISIKRTRIVRVLGKPNWLLIDASPRWNRNSVAHSLLTTWLRSAISNCIGSDMKTIADKDMTHLNRCVWLIDALKKHSMRVFGTLQHEHYDFGMVSFMKRLDTRDFYTGKEDDEPDRYDYDSDEDWEYAMEEWDDYVNSSDYGDLDEPLDAEHDYKKLIELYNKG